MKLRLVKLEPWWSDGRPRPSTLSEEHASPPAGIKLAKHCALALALSMALTISAAGGQIVDRVVTNVNGHVVLQSDWEQEVLSRPLQMAAIRMCSPRPSAKQL